MKVLVQCEGGQFANISHLTAFLGFKEFGYEIELFSWDDIDELDVARETIVAGGIPAVVKILNRLGVQPPTLAAVPPELACFAGRRTWVSTLGELRARHVEDPAEPIFFKPMPGDRKLFNGTVVHQFRDLIPTAAFPADLSVFCSEPVTFVSEYRIFVLQREVIGCKHYKGDFRLFPNFDVIDRAVGAYTSSPAACAIDFGVTRDGRTLVVEVNDAHSLGCHGLSEVRYARMLEVRWRELTGLPID